MAIARAIRDRDGNRPNADAGDPSAQSEETGVTPVTPLTARAKSFV